MDPQKISGASEALKKYLSNQTETPQKSQLFENDAQFIYLNIKSKKFFTEGQIAKPQLIELPTSVWSTRSDPPRICCFVRDPQRKYKDALLSPKTSITRCIGVSKLKGKFKTYEAKRALRQDFDIFLAEEDVVRMLPKLLGKSFYGKQAYTPIPLRICSKDGKINAEVIEHRVQNILKSATVIYPASQSLNVRIATTDHTNDEIKSNVLKVMEGLGMKNVLTVNLKANQSPALPVYYAEKCYSESDIGEHTDDEFETEGTKRKREEERLDELLLEVADEEDIKSYNLDQKKRRKRVAN